MTIFGKFKDFFYEDKKRLVALQAEVSRLNGRDDQTQRQNSELMAQVSSLINRNEDLEDARSQLTTKVSTITLGQAELIRDRDDLAAKLEVKSQDIARLSQDHDSLVHQLDARRWLVKDARGIMLLLDKKSLVDLHVFYHDRWEEDRLDYLMSVVKSVKDVFGGDIYFFDVGSYFGQFSLAIKTDFPDVKVFAFEANPYNFIQLRANLLLNDYVDQIGTFNRCVTNVAGRTQVSRPDMDNRGSAAVGDAYEGEEASVFVVDNIVLDQQFASMSDAVLFMKMDIEGSEPKALEGMKEIFKRNKVFLQIEDWDFPGGDTSRMLKELGCLPVRGMHPDYFYANFDLQAMTEAASAAEA